MHKLIAISIAELKSTLTYRGMILLWMIELFIVPLIMLFVWLTIIQTNPQLVLSKQQLINYYTLLPLFAMLVAAWPAKHLGYKIRTGQLNVSLTKPFQPLTIYLGNNISSKVTKLWFLSPMVIIAALSFKLNLSFSLPTLTLSLLLTFLGAAVNLCLNLILGLLGFWLDEVEALENLYNAAYFTLGGRVIPFFFFPEFFQNVTSFLPFRYIASFPLEIITSNLNSNQIILGIITQTFWLFLSLILVYFLWKKGIRRYESFGG